MSIDRDYPWRDGYDGSKDPVERTSRLDGKVEIIPLDEAVERLARATQQDRWKCKEVLRAGCKLVTAGYEYELQEPPDPPDRPDRRDY